MCIIIAKPAGVDLPSETTLDNCARTNQDGIGFAFNMIGNKPVISKGFVNVKKLLKMIDTFNITKDHNLIIHFRHATHGKKDQGNCHPFPLTDKFEDMRHLHCVCDTAITHNGVFGGMKASDQYSDTMKFINGVLASPEVVNNLDKASVKELIRGYCGFSSKLAFLSAAGIATIGDFEEDEGIKYSNTQYKAWGYVNDRIDKEWCKEHLVYDKCYETQRKDGKDLCYVHKVYDFCRYCSDHRQMDLCHYNRTKVFCCDYIPNQDRPAILDLRLKICEWCNGKEDVKYNYEIQADICTACATLHMHGYH